MLDGQAGSVSKKADRSRRARDAVDRSLDERCLVRITRTVRDVEPIDGVVVAAGIRWVIVSRLSPDLDLDGYTAVRWKHIKKAQTFDPGSVPSRATVRATSLPPMNIADATTTGSLLRSIESTFTPVAVRSESSNPSSFTIGAISGIVAKSVLVLPTLPLDRQDPCLQVPFERVTRIDFGTRYLAGLARAATRGTSR